MPAVLVFLVFFGVCSVGVGDEPLDAEEVLSRYQQSLSWCDMVSMTVDIEGTPTGYADKGDYGVHFVFCRDGGRAEWRGRMFGYDEQGNVDPNKNHSINEVVTGERHISYSNVVGGPLMGVVMSNDCTKRLRRLLESPANGSPLWGRVFGNGHRSVASLLSESADLALRDEQEVVNGQDCYVLEGTSEYGRVTLWVAAEKGYSAMKWSIEKVKGDLFDDEPIPADSWVALFEVVRLEDMNGVFVPVEGVFTLADSYPDGSEYVIRDEYTVSDIDLAPNWEAAGAFSVDLPDGTWVQVEEAPGIRYVWKGGKVVPDVDGPTFDEIDSMIEQIKNSN